MIQDSVDMTIKTLSSHIRRDKRIADAIEKEHADNTDKMDTVKSLRNKVRRMRTARRVLEDYNGCWEM